MGQEEVEYLTDAAPRNSVSELQWQQTLVQALAEDRLSLQVAEQSQDAYLLFGYLSLAELAAAQGEHEQGEQLLRRAERRMHWLHVPEVRYREMNRP